MATQPPPESPVPDSQPADPGLPPQELPGIGPDIDQPSPGTPGTDPGTAQPLQM